MKGSETVSTGIQETESGNPRSKARKPYLQLKKGISYGYVRQGQRSNIVWKTHPCKMMLYASRTHIGTSL